MVVRRANDRRGLARAGGAYEFIRRVRCELAPRRHLGENLADEHGEVVG